MEDMERYGDYNEIDTPPGSRKRPIKILGIIAAVVCFSVIAFVIFRVVASNHYPSMMKNVYFDSVLTEYYNSKSGDVEFLTQNIRSEYDDHKEGNIFCDHLIVIRDAEQLQVAVRFNNSVEDKLKERFGGSGYDVFNEKTFTFRIVRDNPNFENADTFTQRCVLGTLSVKEFDSFMQYGYYKLVFNNVDFSGEDYFDGNTPSWIRLETFLNDGTGECREELKFTQNLIYEDHSDYNTFTEYELSRGEAPGK